MRYILYRIYYNHKGQMEIGLVVGAVVLFAAYAMFPETFHGFVHWVFRNFREALDQGFGGGYGTDSTDADPRKLRGGVTGSGKVK